MFPVVHMGTRRGLRIKLQARIIQLFQTNARSIKTHQGIFPHEVKNTRPSSWPSRNSFLYARCRSRSV